MSLTEIIENNRPPESHQRILPQQPEDHYTGAKPQHSNKNQDQGALNDTDQTFDRSKIPDLILKASIDRPSYRNDINNSPREHILRSYHKTEEHVNPEKPFKKETPDKRIRFIVEAKRSCQYLYEKMGPKSNTEETTSVEGFTQTLTMNQVLPFPKTKSSSIFSRIKNSLKRSDSETLERNLNDSGHGRLVRKVSEYRFLCSRETLTPGGPGMLKISEEVPGEKSNSSGSQTVSVKKARPLY